MTTSSETLRFKIGLSGTYHNNRPKYSVVVNDTEYASGTVSEESGKVFYVEFDAVFIEGTENILRIRLENKNREDTVLDNGEIIKDMLLNIESIEIDALDLGTLIWSKSLYRLDKPHKFDNTIVTELTNCVNLGWNGTYEFAFTSPFYFWLLENF
jgi:hypothetical protein